MICGWHAREKMSGGIAKEKPFEAIVDFNRANG